MTNIRKSAKQKIQQSFARTNILAMTKSTKKCIAHKFINEVQSEDITYTYHFVYRRLITQHSFNILLVTKVSKWKKYTVIFVSSINKMKHFDSEQVNIVLGIVSVIEPRTTA